MKKLYFLFGVHNHQPVGNLIHVFNKAYSEAYRPFIDILIKHPQIKFTLHCSGVLWDFFKEKYPEYILSVKQLLERKQVEIITGGYYEPILPLIPDRDKIGQINKLTEFIKTEFNVIPRGIWLAERIWESYLPKIFNELGIEYTAVDDYHFVASGISPENMRGYCITEEQGYDLKIFSISQKLRYYIPFMEPEETIKYFEEIATEDGHNAIVMIDDGERLGLWPRTYKRVYLDGWLDKFLTLVEQSSDWLTPLTCSEYLDMYPPKSEVYLPDTSYFEMTEWALPTNTQREFQDVLKYVETLSNKKNIYKFLRGGIWRNFLMKYTESNNMHKKMLYISNKIHNLGPKVNTKKKKTKSLNTKLSTLDKARETLYAGQCNCAYWHGIFGGLYLPHLRQAIYRRLIESEKLIDKITCKNKTKFCEIDFDHDGRNELIIETQDQNIYFIPHYGGAISEWDIKNVGVNILNVLTRRQEVYHDKLKEYLRTKIDYDNSSLVKTIHELFRAKEKNLDKHLHYDWHRRLSLLDHFIHPDTKYENFRNCQYGEQGDFVLGQYKWKYVNNKVTLFREGIVWVGEKKIKLNIQKTINLLKPAGAKVTYRISNLTDENTIVQFGTELSFSFSEHKTEDEIALTLDKWYRRDESQRISVEIEFDRKTNLWTFPLETVSLSENGFERTYQGTVVFPWWKIEFRPNSSIEYDFIIKINELTKG